MPCRCPIGPCAPPGRKRCPSSPDSSAPAIPRSPGSSATPRAPGASVEIPSAVRCDWAVIDAIDYDAPGLGGCPRGRAHHRCPCAAARRPGEEQRYRDTVGEWIDQEDWQGWTDPTGHWHDACDLIAGVPADRFYQRYSAWATSAGHERVTDPTPWGIRLAEEQFTKTRAPRSKGKRGWLYHPGVSYQWSKWSNWTTPSTIRTLKTPGLAEVLDPENVNGSNSSGNELVLGPVGPVGPVVSHTITSPLSSNDGPDSKKSQAPPNAYPEKSLPTETDDYEAPF